MPSTQLLPKLRMPRLASYAVETDSITSKCSKKLYNTLKFTRSNTAEPFKPASTRLNLLFISIPHNLPTEDHNQKILHISIF